MRLHRSVLGVLTSFLLGVAWAFVLIGAFYTFFIYYRVGIAEALVMTFLGTLPGLFFVVILEYVISGMERLEEAKKQTSLLNELLKHKIVIIEPEDPNRE
jgi:hypothetical protein